MDFVTWGRNPWGQDVLLHASWGLLEVAAVAAALVAIVHAIAAARRPRATATDAALAPPGFEVPARVERHPAAARLFHWVMAAAMLVLLATAFLPVIGVPFAWVTLHWVAGLVLSAAIVHHAIDSPLRQDFWSIWPNGDDLRDISNGVQLAAGLRAPTPRRPGKYPAANKLFHLLSLVAGAVAIGTGLLMLKRVRVPFLTRDPYLFGDQTWGVLYVLHGLAGIALVGLTLVHLYFALRPDNWRTTRSMFAGWIAGSDYLTHHDPEKWVVSSSRDRSRVGA